MGKPTFLLLKVFSGNLPPLAGLEFVIITSSIYPWKRVAIV